MFKVSSVVVASLLALPALATNPVIYGDDHRQEVFEAAVFHQKLAASAITMIEKAKISRTEETPGVAQIEQSTLRNWLEAQFEEEEKSLRLSKSAKEAVDQKVSFCEGERFTEQPNAGMCSGFLVAPDLVMTAGHCVVVENMCQTYSWVFDFKVDAFTKTAGVDVKEENIYNCKKIISSGLSNGLGLDYGLIQLDRKVTDREPVTLRTNGMVSSGTKLVVIGNPSGLPLKVAAGANVRSSTHPFYFSANLDTFQGNSGSAVFNAESGVVEGILVRGEEDFEANMALMCIEAKRCDDSGCRGEDVSRITSIPEYAVMDALFKIAETGDVKALEKLTKTRFWIDIYGRNGKTALMKSAENKKTELVKALLGKGADATLVDVEGNSALHLAAREVSRKNSDILSILAQAGAPLEGKNKSGETPLLAAAKNLNLEAVKILIQNGADKNAVDLKNENALFSFARKGDLRSVKELISMGVDGSLRNSDGHTVNELQKPGILARLKKAH